MKKGLLRLLLTAILAIAMPGHAATPASWSATANGLTIAIPGRLYQSEVLAPPDAVSALNHRYGKVSWEFHLPPGDSLKAWLCRADDCIPLNRGAGQTTAFLNKDAAKNLHFRFQLAPGATEAIAVTGLQVLVNLR
ncbi:MAG: hypothetical protein EP334_04995 [Gammaproteobacteria bacterium]|nr:MAG: hypothetical protein EP334_04995 [Gammaproteobacteria bacterium]